MARQEPKTQEPEAQPLSLQHLEPTQGTLAGLVGPPPGLTAPYGRDDARTRPARPQVREMKGAVHVCWSPLNAHVSPVDWLDESERGRFDALSQVQDRSAFLTSRMLLKILVGGWPVPLGTWSA